MNIGPSNLGAYDAPGVVSVVGHDSEFGLDNPAMIAQPFARYLAVDFSFVPEMHQLNPERVGNAEEGQVGQELLTQRLTLNEQAKQAGAFG